MKKLLIITNLVWVALFAFCFFKGCGTHQLNDGDIVLNYKDSTFNSLPLEQARNLFRGYVEKRIPFVNKQERIKDAESIWFSLDELKQFAYITEYYTREANVGVSPKDLGVRIYYGLYPNGKEADPILMKTKYAGLHTLFMVPTYMNGKDTTDFDPKTSYDRIKNGVSNTLVPIRIKPLANNIGLFSRAKRSVEPSGVILNHGNLCPPCGSGGGTTRD